MLMTGCCWTTHSLMRKIKMKARTTDMVMICPSKTSIKNRLAVCELNQWNQEMSDKSEGLRKPSASVVEFSSVPFDIAGAREVAGWCQPKYIRFRMVHRSGSFAVKTCC